MRAWAILLLVPALSGCFGFLDDDTGTTSLRPDIEDDPDSYSVSGVRIDEGTLESQDGTDISYKVYVPLTRDAREDGTAIHFPTLILVHPFGYAKEFYEQDPRGEPGPEDPRINLMQRFAESGFITAAYDVRGFGRSGGEVEVGTERDMQDLEAVRRMVQTTYDHNGHFGVAGVSLGGGIALRAFVSNPEIDTAAPISGWTDLYDAILPGNTPKAEWAAGLVVQGESTSGGQFSDEIEGWIADSVQRENLQNIEGGMDLRSAGRFLPQTDKPLFLCQGINESLFPQIDLAWEAAAGFTRAAVVTGGHGFEDRACWDRIHDWMDYFLRGVDNGVPTWPFLESVDAYPDAPTLTFGQGALDRTATQTWYLHDGNLVAGPSGREFTVSQRLLSNPLQEPAIVGDVAGQQEVPEQFRQDPFAVFFTSDTRDTAEVILGAPTVTFDVASTNTTDFQVVATLIAVHDGDSRILSRGAYSHKDNVTAAHDGEVEVRMHWTKATVPSGAYYLLKVSANDNSWFAPFPDNFDVDFTGESHLDLPVFQG